MDLTQIALFAVSLITGAIGWFCSQLWTSVKQLNEDLNALHIKLSSEYVRYDRLQDSFKPIMDALQEIKETLKNKVDK